MVGAMGFSVPADAIAMAVYAEGEHVISDSQGLTAKIWAVSSEQAAGKPPWV